MVRVEKPNLTHVRLLVSDFPACFRFYRDVFGFNVTYGDEDDRYADFEAGDALLALFKRDLMATAVGASDKPSQAESQDKVALVFNVANVDSARQELEKRGARFVTKPTDLPGWGIRAAHLRDPDGNLIELYQDLPRT